MKKFKYLFLLLVMILVPFNVFANAVDRDCNDGYYGNFILEDSSGSRINNARINLESNDGKYSGIAKYITNGIYQININEIGEAYHGEKLTSGPFIYIKNSNNIIGVYYLYNKSYFYKYDKNADYSSRDNLINYFSGLNLSEDMLYERYVFKNSNNDYVDYNTIVCGANYEENNLPIITLNSVKKNKNHSQSIYIKSSELTDISENTEELNNPVIKDLQVNFDLKFTNLNDYATYKLVIRNDSDKDYELSNDNFNKSDYITYDFRFDNDDKTIKANSEKTAYITIKYTKEVPADKLVNGGYTEDNKLGINFKRAGETLLTNPETGTRNVVILVIVLSVVVLLLYKSLRSKNKLKYMNLLLPGLIAIPLTTKAVELLQIDVITHIEIVQDKKFCYITDWNRDEDGKLTTPKKTYFKYKDGMTWNEYMNSKFNIFSNEEFYKINSNFP